MTEKKMSRSEAQIYTTKRGAVAVGQLAISMGLEYDSFMGGELPLWLKQGYRLCCGEGRAYLHVWNPRWWWEKVEVHAKANEKKIYATRIHPSTLIALAKRENPEVFDPSELPQGRKPKESKLKARKQKQAKQLMGQLKGGPKKAVELAQATGLTYAITLRLLHRLEELGYVERSVAKAEGRGRPATLYRRKK